MIGRAIIAMLVTACAGRAARPTPTSESTPPGTADAALTAPDAAPEPSGPPSGDVSPPPQLRLAWVNPSRCARPCTYDPKDSLVRVDNNGVPDATGTHLVHRSIQQPLHDLVAAAHAAGHKIRIESAFRSYEDQARLFKRIKQIGRAARPGHSEHQLGTAVDFRMPTSAAISWLGENATGFGFALSYPDGKQRVTGYRPEPWHVRFVGHELAKKVRDNAWSLEELFRAQPDLGESGSCDDCPQPVSRTPCGDISVAGKCDGSVLQWCYDGTLATVDCAASKQRCGRARGSAEHDCIAR